MSLEITATEMEEIQILALDGDNIGPFLRLIPPELAAGIKNGAFMALGAVAGGDACGAIVFGYADGSVRLESVYVAPDYRRQLIGTTLFCEMADFFEMNAELGASLITVTYADAGEAFSFFESLGFQQEPLEGKTIAVYVSELTKCELLRDGGNTDAVITPLSALSPAHIRELNTELIKNGANLSGTPVSHETAIPELSFVHYRDGRPVGCVCFAQGDAHDELVLSIFFTGASGAAALVLFKAAAAAITESRPAKDKILIPIVNTGAEKIVERILGDRAFVCETLYRGVLTFGINTEAVI